MNKKLSLVKVTQLFVAAHFISYHPSGKNRSNFTFNQRSEGNSNSAFRVDDVPSSVDQYRLASYISHVSEAFMDDED